MQNEAERLYEAKDGAEIMSSKHDHSSHVLTATVPIGTGTQ